MSHKFIPYNSDTTGNEPASASLIKGELAVNIADKKLWVGDASGDPVALNSPHRNEITVGAGKDFETLDDLAIFLETYPITGQFTKVSLDDGVHMMGASGTLTYLQFAGNVTFESVSSDKTLCTVTLHPNAVLPSNYLHALLTTRTGYISIQHITFDPLAGGWVGTFHSISTCIRVEENSFGNFGNLIIKNTPNCIGFSSGRGHISSSVSFENADLAVRVSSVSNVVSQATTLTNVTEHSNLPFNEIQYDGAYISTNTVALSFKA